MKIQFLTVLMLAFALFMSACGKSDADLLKAANDKLTADKVMGVTVAVKDGVATLTGEVADAAVKSKAEASVKTVEGIKSVTNNCTIKPAPTPPPPSPDKMIEGTVNEAIKKLALTGANITVAVANGEITLTGDVAKADLVKVMQAANEAKGNATKVNNKLTVK
ncbi:MAG: BON domain-containing protein [Pyrinomonadaceae bacterium]|nr:BON domain-containing protein [Acidobacteriota bacterium]MBP7473877.1 BON domain-containing protein [Pyrinomonadaceae bacterium]MBP9108480.1 BON domain-containing protein [Pyrinomonadaceae bacterium]